MNKDPTIISSKLKNEINPFVLPSDEEIFRIRDEEKINKLKEKEYKSTLHVNEKTTNSSNIGRIKKYNNIIASNTTNINDNDINNDTNNILNKQTRGLVAAATTSITNDHRREKENVYDFIAKKKEMFLVQMSLDTKREEIRKLEEKAQLKEEALKKSELMLEEDAIRFDTFLKENDKKAHEAIKKAEKETKFKSDKINEIKKLNQQIQLIQSDMSKLKEQLEDCLKYKSFLDSLTPPEWEAKQKLIKKQRQIKRLEDRRQERLKEYDNIKNKSNILSNVGASIINNNNSNNKNIINNTIPSINMDDLVLTSSGEDIPMYFQHPNQLLDIFTSLEESNLFLIQNSQETEQALEELKQNYNETKKNTDKKTNILQNNIELLQNQINTEEKKAIILRSRTENNMKENKQDTLLNQLHDKICQVYRKCGFDGDSNPSILLMLTDLEERLEYLIQTIEKMPEEYVLKAEKEKEKERRERVRMERIKGQEKMYEERMKKSMERSMQAPKKKKGKQIMVRSMPLRRNKEIEKNNHQNTHDQADLQFFT